jgi:hypothetical protein
MRAVVLHPGEDGYWVVECPSLPGCISQGKTKTDAIANIKEAIARLDRDGQGPRSLDPRRLGVAVLSDRSRLCVLSAGLRRRL